VRGSFAVGDERYYPNGAECDDGCLSELEELMFDGAAGGAGGGAGAGGSR
jgi:hypothetical protein